MNAGAADLMSPTRLFVPLALLLRHLLGRQLPPPDLICHASAELAVLRLGHRGSLQVAGQEANRAPLVFHLDRDREYWLYTEIEELVKNKVHSLIFLGVDNTKLHAFFDGKVPVIEDAQSMEEAISKAYKLASKGDTVLLSPCCASFDLFKNYEDRGNQFKACVLNL